MERPEIDIGITASLTPDSWASALVRYFALAGYTVGLNRPYAGVIDAGAAAAVMIEIRRDIFGGGPGTVGWPRLVHTLQLMPIHGRST